MLGATGRFGGIVELLLARGHRVRAGARDPDSPAAVRLADLGAQLVHADFDEPGSIEAAARGVDAVFASGTAHRAGPDGEARHGINLADALAVADVAHLVFVSGAGADRPTGVPVLEAKRAVEQRIANRGVPATVLAPVYLMENLLNPWNLRSLRAGRFPAPIPSSLALEQVPVSDVISLAALAIDRSEQLIGERIELASDAPSGEQAAAIVSRIAGVRLIAEQLERAALPPGLVTLFEWLEREPVTVEARALRRRFGDLVWHDFGRWAEAHQQQLVAAIRPSTEPGEKAGV